MAKRLTRARRKIVVARLPYRVPGADELPVRLRGVLATVYLLFNEGYATSAGERALAPERCAEALRLARLLRELLPQEAGVLGLLALLLLQDARRAARTDERGEPVLLADQDRSRYDRAAVREGVVLLGTALRRCPVDPDPYVVQAAIAACHDLTPSWPETDWGAIVSWYDVLVRTADLPVTRLNRAVAIGELNGAAAGLDEVDAVAGLEGYPWWHAARAELLHRLGEHEAATRAYDRALELALNEPQRRQLTRRREAVRTRP